MRVLRCSHFISFLVADLGYCAVLRVDSKTEQGWGVPCCGSNARSEHLLYA